MMGPGMPGLPRWMAEIISHAKCHVYSLHLAALLSAFLMCLAVSFVSGSGIICGLKLQSAMLTTLQTHNVGFLTLQTRNLQTRNVGVLTLQVCNFQWTLQTAIFSKIADLQCQTNIAGMQCKRKPKTGRSDCQSRMWRKKPRLSQDHSRCVERPWCLLLLHERYTAICCVNTALTDAKYSKRKYLTWKHTHNYNTGFFLFSSNWTTWPSCSSLT